MQNLLIRISKIFGINESQELASMPLVTNTLFSFQNLKVISLSLSVTHSRTLSLSHIHTHRFRTMRGLCMLSKSLHWQSMRTRAQSPSKILRLVVCTCHGYSKTERNIKTNTDNCMERSQTGTFDHIKQHDQFE